MQVNLLTVGLDHFEMVLFLIGLLAGSWAFNFVLLPCLYGFPYCLYWALRGWADWRCTLLYLVTPCLWLLAFLISGLILLFLYPVAMRQLAGSEGFALGSGATVIVLLARMAFWQPARMLITRKLRGFLEAHLTLEGSAEMKSKNWPDSSQDYEL